MLGTLLKYRDGRPVAPDIAAWARDALKGDRTILTKWTESDPYLAERWGAANADYLATWEKDHAAAVDAWKKDNPDAEITPTDLAGLYFASYAQGETQEWPETDGTDPATAFFELWWKAHPKADVAPVPADLVMASGAGLDPHITLDGALYQLDRVAAAWAAKKNRSPADVKKEIEGLLEETASAPLGGLVGVDLVNVLEINLALRDKYGS
jgi:K+-transporting ATPase ATPase C chain